MPAMVARGAKDERSVATMMPAKQLFVNKQKMQDGLYRLL
jgi:urease gamma subunit